MNIYCLTLFTDFVGDPAIRSNCGYGFIALIGIYVLVHMCILVTASVIAAKWALKKC